MTNIGGFLTSLSAADIVDLHPATEAEMQAGTETSIRSMSPLNVAQAIDALAEGGGGGGSQGALILLACPGATKGGVLGYSVGPTAGFSNFPDDSCDPLVGIGGSALTSLSFSSCGFYGNFSLPDTSGLTALTTLTFSSCGSYGFSLSDTSGLTSLTSLTFSNCGYDGFALPDTSGLTALTSLSFDSCGYFTEFLIFDTSGFTTLTSLSFSNCGYDGTFSIVDSVSLLPEAKALIILNAVDNGTGNGIGPITLHVTGTSTLQTAKTSLEGKGYTVTLTTP